MFFGATPPVANTESPPVSYLSLLPPVLRLYVQEHVGREQMHAIAEKKSELEIREAALIQDTVNLDKYNYPHQHHLSVSAWNSIRIERSNLNSEYHALSSQERLDQAIREYICPQEMWTLKNYRLVQSGKLSDGF